MGREVVGYVGEVVGPYMGHDVVEGVLCNYHLGHGFQEVAAFCKHPSSGAHAWASVVYEDHG